MKPVFCGNFDYDMRHSELERLFSKYGRIDRIDMKSGYAFVYFEDERDAEDAIRYLDNMPLGYGRRRLSVEWSRQGERGGPRGRDSRHMANVRPTKTLFVINFDPIRTMVRDIERHFEPYGKVLHVRIRKNFAFVQFENQEEATNALECTNMSKILDRVVTVEYAFRDDDDRDDRRDSPRRGGYGRHDSPYARRPSPEYGRRRSPDYGRRSSPDYGRRPSPDYGRRSSADYDRRGPSPGYGRYNGPSYDRNTSPVYGGRYRSRSPVRSSRQNLK